MAKLYILCGYPFAGKSTLAKTLGEKHNFKRIALDELKIELGLADELAQDTVSNK